MQFTMYHDAIASTAPCHTHKRLVVCCDGTWNEPTDSPTSQHPTNVFKLAQSIPAQDQTGMPQVVYYARGLGSGDGLDRWLGGAFGVGIDQEIQDAYIFLSMNYHPGDEIYLFGFSRGAYTVRSLAGFISTAGLLHPEQLRQLPRQPGLGEHKPPQNQLEAAYQLYRADDSAERHLLAEAFRQAPGNYGPVEIKLLCCWDTVGALGIPRLIPGLTLGNRYRFHDCKLSPKVKHALHAVAIDERRKIFDVTPMNRQKNDPNHLEQMLFPGGHGCVGGGTLENAPLSNGALQWVVDAIAHLSLGLEINLAQIGETLTPAGRLPVNPLAPLASGEDSILQLFWKALSIWSRNFARQIPQVQDGKDLEWLARQLGCTAETLRKGQTHPRPEYQNQSCPEDGLTAVYGIHESLKVRLEVLGNLAQFQTEQSRSQALPNGYFPQSLINYLVRVRSTQSSRSLDASPVTNASEILPQA